ncbi:hypothetical protein D3C79_978620 [compost metagenome]
MTASFALASARVRGGSSAAKAGKAHQSSKVARVARNRLIIRFMMQSRFRVNKVKK